ncbi:MAG: histidine kinase, partial [Ferruginibacter sp.]
VSIEIDPGIKKTSWIPPLVLQLLTENAVKHNTVSKDKPLYISIITNKDQIVVRNTINYKMEKEESEGVGLKNIKNRYKLLTDREVKQEENNMEFIIRLPIIYN